MDITSKVKIHNKFDIVVRDTKTGKQKERYEAYNIVKNYCYDVILGNPKELWRYIAYGSGTGTPDPTSNRLLNFLGSVPATRDSLTYGMPTTVAVYTGRIGSNQAVGQLITEIGLASNNYSSSILTHALIKDSAGNPIAIQKTDQDIIDIYATVYFNLEDLSAVYGDNVRWVNPENNAMIQRLLGNSPSHISYLYGEVADHEDMFYLGKELSNTPNTSVDTPNRKILLPTTRFSEQAANGEIKGVRVLGAVDIKFPVQNIWNGFQFDNIDVATGDGVKTEFTLPWDDIRPGTLQVFVDGTPVTPTEVYERKSKVLSIASDDIGGLRRMTAMSYQKNGGYVAIGLWDNTLRIYKISSTGRITMTDSIQYTNKRVLGVDFTSDFTSLFVVTSDGVFSGYAFDPVTGKIGALVYTAGSGMSQIANDLSKLSNLRVMPGDKVIAMQLDGRGFASVSLDTAFKRYGDLVLLANVNFSYEVDVSADGTAILSPAYYDNPSIYPFDPNTGVLGAPKKITGSNNGSGYSIGAIHPQKLGIVTAIDSSQNNMSQLAFASIDSAYNLVGSVFNSSDASTGARYDNIRSLAFNPDGRFLATSVRRVAITIHHVDFINRVATWIGTQFNGRNAVGGYDTFSRRLVWVANDIVVNFTEDNDNGTSGSSLSAVKIIANPNYHFKLPTPPASGAKITASFAVDYIPKTSNYVLDLSASLQLM